MSRIVLHVDLDAFFAAVEERDHPAFRGFPLVVGADPKEGSGRGVVSTANYEARKYGVHSAQPISQAWQLCKAGEKKGGKPCIFFRGNFEKYERESQKVMRIIAKYGDKFEQVGIDEAYIELKILNPKSNPFDKLRVVPSESRDKIRNKSQIPISQFYKHAERIARKIKREINKETKLTCSVGAGPNKLVAKIASDFQKPDGLTIVPSEKVQEFLDPLPVIKIPGIGPKADAILEKRGIRTIAQLRNISKEKLIEWFGKWGEDMYAAARGQDERPVGEERKTKSIGREHTFEEDTLDAETLFATIKELAVRVAKDTQEEGVRFRTVELKVRLTGFVTKTRAKTLPQAEKSTAVLERVGMTLLLPFLDRRENPQRKKIRLIGLRVSNLV